MSGLRHEAAGALDGRPRVASPASPLGDPVVNINSLSKRYGEVVAVDDVSFSLARGTVTGYLGPNGAGKTTTLRLLLGLAEPSAGEALVFGRRYPELHPPPRGAARAGGGGGLCFPPPLPRARAAHAAGGRSAGVERLSPRPLRAQPPEDARARGRAAIEPRRRGLGARRARRQGRPAGQDLLARDASAARTRRRPARRPRAARARRACERARSGRGALAADLPARFRGAGRQRARLQPRARRGSAGGRSSRDHRPRPPCRGHAAGGAHKRWPNARRRLPGTDRGEAAMSAALRAELFKQRSTWTALALLAALLGLVAIAVILHVYGFGADELGRKSNQLEVFNPGQLLGGLFAALLGAMAITAEIRYGTIRPTLLVTPWRSRVVAAKVAASTLIGAGFGLAAGGVAAAVGTVALGARG